jgi:hypothetical protein
MDITSLPDPKKIDFKKKSNVVMVVLVVLSFLTTIGLLVYYLEYKEGVWDTNEVPNEDINKRQKDRGMVASIITSYLSIFISSIMVLFAKSDVATYQALISILCGGVVGFVLDNAIATENGAKILLNGINYNEEFGMNTISESLKFGFGSIISPKLLRYFIVMMLDIFISIILTDGLVWMMLKKGRVNQSLAEVFAMIVVSITTFLAYANATRLEWAYPAVDKFNNRSALIPTSTILLSTIISSMVFLIWKPLTSESIGIKSTEGKLISILALFVIIVYCYYMGYLEPQLKEDIKLTVVPCSNEPEDRCVDFIIDENKIETVEEIYDNRTFGIFMFTSLCILASIITLFSGKTFFDKTKICNKNNYIYLVASIIIFLIPVLLTLI